MKVSKVEQQAEEIVKAATAAAVMSGYGGNQYTQQQQQQYAAVPQGDMYAELLAPFWEQQVQEVGQVGRDAAEFKNHQLPLARIKKIMKSDEDVRMISAEAPVLFAKACEMFILEMTLRSWAHAEENRRRTLQRSDVAAAISRNEIFDFLADVVPVDEAAKEGEQAAAPSPAVQPAAAAAAPGMYAYNYTAADQAAAVAAAAAAAGGAVDPAMLAYQQQAGLVPGQQWAAGGLPDGAADGQQ
uniref:Transcription factor CBF/NF-Y/archaeal histone domain-containing protein n=1 Tax=Tetradesmus obliquus TaxID=3088 RepID=A0A383WLY7_TETOB|eukprot:jgi/Sobl393_1/17395/SZX76848.1